MMMMKKTYLRLLLLLGISRTARAWVHHTILPTIIHSNNHNNNRRRTAQPQLQNSYIDIDESAVRDVATFDEWAGTCGVQRSDGFRLTGDEDNNNMDVSVVTTEDLPAQSPVLFVPHEMILSARQSLLEIGQLNEAERRLVSANAAKHVPKFYLFLRILQEFEQGDASPWFPWFNALPRYYSNGASMTPFCFECLPPLAASLAMAERIKFIQFFQALKYVDFLSDEVKGSKELAKWAFAVVYTRGFGTPDGDFCVTPMADMFNHAAEPDVELTYDEDGNCCVYTVRDVPAGQPLCLQYADPTNPSFLFARYGFLDESCNASFCKIMIKQPSPQLVDLGYDHSRMLFTKDTGDVSPEVWDVLLYQILEAEDPAVQQQFYQAHMQGDDETKQAIHNHYFAQTSVALSNHVDTFLRELQVLQSKGAGKDVAEHPRLPLIMQHNEFVEETFLAVQSNLAQYAYA